MIDLQKGFDISKGLVVSKFKHPNWQRTVDIAREYKAMITGEDLEFMLRKFDRRESEEAFKQANCIAQYITPSITAALMNPARRLGNVKPVVDRMDYGRENDPKADALRAGINGFLTNTGVDQYLSRLVDPSDADPNGFEILTFNTFDNRFEKPQVYPISVPCENVFNAPKLNGELQYLWLCFPIRYVVTEAKYGANGDKINEEVTSEGKRYVQYIDNHHIVLEQVSKELKVAPVVGLLYTEGGDIIEISGNKGVEFGATYYWRSSKDELFRVSFFDQKSGIVPAYALGCKPDPLTNGVTYVNRWHEAMPHLKKSLKQVRELDLTIALHVHAQRIEISNPCTAAGCLGGSLVGGEKCPSCNGTGDKDTATTAQDHIRVPRPRDLKDLPDITKFVHYFNLPVELVQQLRDIVKDTRADCFKAVYGFDLFGDGKVGKTVEEVQAMNQSQYVALSPMTMWRERTHTRIVTVYANYNDMGAGLIVQYKYPSDLGFETGAEILRLMKLGSEAGASTDYLANLNLKLDTWTFSDDPTALARVKTQARFNPYPGRSETAISALIASGKALPRSELMYNERATIFALAEEKGGGAEKFYGLADAKQNEIVSVIIDAMLAEIAEKNAAPVMSVVGVDEGVDPETGLPLEQAA